MTIGPAPMIRIDLMSVRFGIRSRITGHKKRARLVRVPRTAPRSGLARERVFRPDSAGREGRRRGSPPRARNAWASQRGFVAQIHRARNVARAAPVNCARMKAMTPAGAIPAKVSESARARVTAGLAKDVEAVN